MALTRKNSFLFLFLFFLGLVVILYLWVQSITGKIFIFPGKFAQASTNSVQQYLATKTPFNILLLGYGGGNHDGAYLTDSIMLVHIDPKSQKIFLISIPRDIWTKIPSNGSSGSYWKINTAYTIGMDDTDYPNKSPQFKGPDGGGKLAEYVVSQITGLTTNYFVGMDFSGFVKTIDALGGVDIDVETMFDDYEYPITGKENDLCGHPAADLPKLEAEATQSAIETVFPCRYEHLHFNAGLQHMDGAIALKYVRSRHSLQDGTDFGRAKRQRNLLVAVKQKVLSAGFIPNIIPFTSSLGDDVKTDLTLEDVKSLVQNSNTLSKYQISTLALTDQNFLIDTYSSDGQAILQPKDGLDNWTNTHNWLSYTITGKPEPIPAVVEVENGTHIVGLAGLASNRLKNEGLQVIDPTNADNQNLQQTTITIFDKNVFPNHIDTLKKEFGVNSISYSSSTSKNLYNVLVVVGQNYNLLEGKKFLNE